MFCFTYAKHHLIKLKLYTLESRIIGGVGIIGGGGGLDIVRIINNGGIGIIGEVERGRKNSVGGFLVLIC